MSGANNKTVIRLLGNDYTITGAETEEYMQQVGFFVDKQLSEIAGKNTKLSTKMVAVLASINIADECFKLKEGCESLREQLDECTEKYKKSVTAVNELKRKNELLNQEIQRLKIEIAKLEVKK